MHSQHLSARATADGPFTTIVTPESADWQRASLWVLELGANEGFSLESEDDELLIVPLQGAANVVCGDTQIELAGRASMFHGPTDAAYVGRNTAFSIDTEAGGRFAICGARANRDLPPAHVTADQVVVELGGAGAASRQIHHIAMPDGFAADTLQVLEVLTPGGNWSSYPPHKHDDAGAGETELEVLYYYEFAEPADVEPAGTSGKRGFGFHHGQSTGALTVRDGDVVLVPTGFHGPSIAAPGIDMYYLNVLAGPIRGYKYTDQPDLDWVRPGWEDARLDPRLPFRAPEPEPE